MEKQETIEIKHSVLPSTYALQTAETILNDYNVHLSQEDIEHQLESDESFYKELLKVPAKSVYNNNLINKSREMQLYCQERIVNIVFADHNLIAKRETKDLKSNLSEKRGKELNRLLDETDKSMHELDDACDKQDALQEDLKNLAKEQVKQWRTLNEKNADEVIRHLKDNDFTLSDTFKERLLKRLDSLGSDVNFSKEQRSKFKIKGKLSGVNKAVFSTLLEEADNG